MRTVERALMGIIAIPVSVFKDGRDPTVLLVSTLTCPEPNRLVWFIVDIKSTIVV